MKTFAFAAMIAISSMLAGCAELTSLDAQLQTVQNQVQTELVQDLPTACNLLYGADASFQTIAATQAGIKKPLSASVLSDESAAVAAVQTVCTNPPPASTTALLAQALKAYAAVMQALAFAKTAQVQS